MSTHGKDDGRDGPEGRDGRDGLGARRRASWGRRDDEERAEGREDERAEQRGRDGRAGGACSKSTKKRNRTLGTEL